MELLKTIRVPGIFWIPVFWVLGSGVVRGEVGYNRDVRPILSSKCFTCHGPDAAKRKPTKDPLRLDVRESAVGERAGGAAIVPGDLGKSGLVGRITSLDADEQMPPEDFHPKLTDGERETLKRWIAEGARYESHWAFVRPVKGELPAVADAGWVRNGVDAFVGARLNSEGVKASGEATKETLVRRVTLSLTGLPPTAAEVGAFVGDASPDAYEKMVDRALGSEKYGERMAWFWLDAARYADTDGYQGDKGRTMWPWRDWVIKAFNENMGFDQFTVEQLAGDLLPEAGDQALLASAFNRNHRLNNEGGALPEEFIVEYAIDRAETTSAVWLGLTMGCARCHDHKYDPISQKEFFQFYGYFNNIGENGKAGGLDAPPMISVASPLAGDAEGREAEAGLAAAEAALEVLLGDAVRGAEWERGVLAELGSERAMWLPPAEVTAVAKAGGTLEKKGDGSFLYTGKNAAKEVYEVTVTPPPGMERVTAVRLEVMGDGTLAKPTGYARSTNGNFVLTAFEVGMLEPGEGAGGAKPVGIGRAEATYEQPKFGVAGAVNPGAKDGWALGANPQGGREAIYASFVLKEPIAVAEGVQITVRMRHGSQFPQHNVGRFRIQLSDAAAPVADGESGVDQELVAALKTAVGDRTGEQRGLVRSFRVANDPGLKGAAGEILKWEEKAKASQGPAVKVMVMREQAEVMPTYLLERGQYDAPDKSKVLSRRLPEALTGKVDGEGAPGDRLGMARWLVSEENPLTARVTVNRIWQQHFGTGLVKTSEDFGAQGELPSHPALLDWLAVEFMESGWDVKALHRLILTSATYRQSSVVTAEMAERDPENRLLARGPRFRLDGAAIRDQAIYLGGLMNGRMGGAPVKPYQPQGLWQAVAGSSNESYGQGEGADLYRRSLYTYWKRAVAPPQLLIFDASGREVCNVRNRVTNTPLQALVLMNDETFVEAARALGERMIKEGGATEEGRIRFGFQTATGRAVDEARLEILMGNYRFYKDHFSRDTAAGEAFLSVGESARDATIPPAEAAAYAAVAHLLLNLDETITLE